MIRRICVSAAIAGLVALGGGCASAPTVTRVVDGRIVEGHFVEPDAYAAFLRGAISESHGDLRGALAAYEETAKLDEEDPEVWTRIAAVRCRLSAADPGARWAAARALALDTEYAPAWEVRAQCELGRSEDRVSIERDALRAADADPTKVDYQVLLARVEEMRPRSEVARQRLVALTLAHEASPVAWSALASWSRSHGDALGAAQALARVARLAPTRRADVVREVIALAGEGELDAARFLAGAVLDAGRDTDRSGGLTPSPANHPLVARLAIDDAIVKGDFEVLRLRRTAAHLGVDTVAGRALLLGKPGLVAALVTPTIDADPRAAGPRMTLAVAAAYAGDATLLTRALATTTSIDAPIATEVWLPFVKLVASHVSAADARRLFDALPREAIASGDDLVVRAAVDAAARDMIDPGALPLDGRVELAARQGVPFAVSLDALDARHRLLALSSGRTAEAYRLLRHLAPAIDHDRVVAVAAARLRMGDPKGDAISAERLAAVAPGDPLVVSTALALAVERHDAPAAMKMRARLVALGLPPD
ncbi:MAG: Tetratricopeptide 2 repeat protein [Myxococcaceae bacterium]|nr:Tetratricopeptide 2 repeat protein [Myxococcaceae bacterium]